MSLVGDIIMQLRRRIPDAPMAFQLTGTPIITPISGAPGGQFGPGPDFFFRITNTNSFGETNACPEIGPIIFAPGQNAIQISLVGVASLTSGDDRMMRIYVGLYPGQETQFYEIPLIGGVAVYTLTGSEPVQPGIPPTRSTCFFPDSDGNFIGAKTAYNLLNEANAEMVRIAGGIIDVTGVRSQVNQSMYRLDAPFYQFINAWFDGYPMDVVQRSMMYLRNSAAGFSGILSYEQDGPQSVIQVWPQSNRTGGQNFLAAPLSADANTFLVSDGRSFLSIGLAQIEDEIVVYSQITAGGTVFSGVLRGMGGTDAVAHPIFAPVTELNIRLSGYRMARTYDVGDSTLTIQVPQAWERPLVLHMLSQVRSMEQDEAASKELLSQFVSMADKIAKQSRMGKLKPRQIPIWGQTATDARNVNGIGFGWLIN